MTAFPQACQLKVRLPGIGPMTWRRVLVPASTPLRDSHGIRQAAMGWEGLHPFLFDVHAKRHGAPWSRAAIPDVALQEFGLRENDQPGRHIQLQGGSHHWFSVRVST